MSEFDQQQSGDAVAPQGERSSIARILMGKTLKNPMFSEKTALWVLIALAFFLPIFFIPGQTFAPEFSKMILLEVAVLLGVLAWAGSRLRDGILSVPRSILLGSMFLIVAIFGVTAMASPTPLVSLVGSGGELGTLTAIGMLFLLMFLGSLVFRTRDSVLYLYAAILLSTVLLLVYHLIRHFAGPILDFGFFSNPVSSPVGKWNDFASLVGAMMVLLLTTLYFFSGNKTLRIPSAILFLVGLFFLIVVDFTILWVILFVMSGLIILFSVYEGERGHKLAVAEGREVSPHPRNRRIVGHVPFFAFVLFVVALVYGSGLMNMKVGDKTAATIVGEALNTSPYSEVVLTSGFTFDIVKQTLQESPLIGTGPNRFASGYLKYKTSDMNVTPFWDATFDSGIGRIPTFFGTTGVVGTLLWVIFILAIFYKLRVVYPLVKKDRVSAYIGFSLFLLVMFFWSIAFFYLPNVTVFSFAFLLTGALIGFLVSEGVIREYHAKFSGSGVASFVVTPALIIVLIGAISASLMLYRQTQSVRLFADAQREVIAGNVQSAGLAINKASEYADRDLYQRFSSSLALLELQQLANQKDLKPEEVAVKAGTLVGIARTAAEKAILLDKTNFENYLALGSVYDTLVTLGIDQTKEGGRVADNARVAYTAALQQNPHSPRIMFSLARLELLEGNSTKAKEFLRAALGERPNFLEALSLLTQLEMRDNNSAEAVKYLSAGAVLEPTNFLLRFALGYLYYTQDDYQNAIVNFESAVFVNPVYADAKYFLGLSYAKTGRTQDAIRQFEQVQDLNPDNKEVAKILRNLRDNRQPFDAGIVPPQEAVDSALSGIDAQGRGESKNNN